MKDLLRGSIGFVNNGKPISKANYKNLKTQCYYKLAEMINLDKIYLQDNKDSELITQELEWVKTYDNDKDNKLQILPKDTVKKHIKRSPDYADCLAMRMVAELKPRSRFS